MMLIKLEKSEKDNIDNMLDSDNITHNVNIAIASAITAYSRIHMTKFKNNDNIKLFYSDTDSIYINAPLDDNLISDKILGAMKLEHICNKVVFLAPKVYGLLSIDGKEIIKVKGLNNLNDITINHLEELLIKDNKLEIDQDKWYKSLVPYGRKVI